MYGYPIMLVCSRRNECKSLSPEIRRLSACHDGPPVSPGKKITDSISRKRPLELIPLIELYLRGYLSQEIYMALSNSLS